MPSDCSSAFAWNCEHHEKLCRVFQSALHSPCIKFGPQSPSFNYMHEWYKVLFGSSDILLQWRPTLHEWPHTETPEACETRVGGQMMEAECCMRKENGMSKRAPKSHGMAGILKPSGRGVIERLKTGTTRQRTWRIVGSEKNVECGSRRKWKSCSAYLGRDKRVLHYPTTLCIDGRERLSGWFISRGIHHVWGLASRFGQRPLAIVIGSYRIKLETVGWLANLSFSTRKPRRHMQHSCLFTHELKAHTEGCSTKEHKRGLSRDE